MATYAYLKLYCFNKNKTIARAIDTICVNYAKNIMELNEWPEDFGYDDDFTNAKSDVKGKYVCNGKVLQPDEELIGYLNPSQDCLDNQIEKTDEYYKVNCLFDSYNLKNAGVIKDSVSDTDVLAGWKPIIQKKDYYNGICIDEDELEKLYERTKAKCDEKRKEFYKLSSYKDNIEWYKLNEKQKSHIEEDIRSAEEFIEEYEYSMIASQKLIGAISLFKEEWAKEYDDNIIAYLFLC